MEAKEKFLEWAEEAIGAERREEVEIDHSLNRARFAGWFNQKVEARVDRSPFRND